MIQILLFVSLVLLLCGLAYATEKTQQSPETIALITYFWVILIASLGGFVSFMRKVKSGHARAWNFAEFVGEIATSAFAGILTYWLCEWSGFQPLLTAAMVGISGHMGSRAVFLIEKFVESKFPADIDKHIHMRKGDDANS